MRRGAVVLIAVAGGLLLAPLVSGYGGNAYTQASNAATVSSGGCAASNTVSVTAGREYVLVGWAEDNSGPTVAAYMEMDYQSGPQAGAHLLNVLKSGALNSDTGADRAYLYHNNISGSAFTFAAQFRATSTGAVDMECTRYNTPGWVVNGTTGLLGTFTIGGNAVAYLFDANVSLLVPPSAPVITVAPGVEEALISWAAVATATHYSVFRDDATHGGTLPLNASYTYLGSTTGTSWRDSSAAVDVQNFYRVQAMNGSLGSLASNEVFAVPWTITFTGEHSAFYGGNRTHFSESAQISATAVDIGFSLLVVLFMAGLGYKFAEMAGAAVGAIVGVVIAIALGWFPVWAAFFLAVVGAAGFVLRRRAAAGGG